MVKKISCKKCGGYIKCDHDVYLHNCAKCGGCSTCVHSKIKANCRICSPHNYCKDHNKFRQSCRICPYERKHRNVTKKFNNDKDVEDSLTKKRKRFNNESRSFIDTEVYYEPISKRTRYTS